MSIKALHALLTLIVGLGFGVTWLRAFWNRPGSVSSVVLIAPLAAALLGLGHWIAYDFSLAHWAGDFSLLQALFNIGVTFLLLARRRQMT
ncbi:MAG: hypothetical protein ACT4P6_00930 [Gemmatimonadaceae bacterium]